MNVAHRLESIQPFRVMALLARANELAQEGHDVIHMEVGEPDFPTPDPIVAAGHAALREGRGRYTDARGTPELRNRIAEHYASVFGVEIAPSRIFVTAGASGGLLLLTSLLVNPGENLLMTDPGYPCNRHFLTNIGAEGRLVPVDETTDYQLNAEIVAKHWDSSTRGVLIASPANPTGSILDASLLSALDKLVVSRDGALIVDEIYQGLVYGDQEPTTVLSVSDSAFVINSFSKYFGMTGWRLGWVVIPESCSAALEKLAQNLFICPSALSQHAALAAFEPASIGIMEAQRRELEARRDYLVPALKALGFVVPTEPVGAFYVYAGLPQGYNNSEAFCEMLLEKYHVAITPGTDFGFHHADQRVRFSYAVSIDRLEEAVNRIGKMLS